MERVELPRGYELDEVGQNLLLKRPNGYVLAAFGERGKPENIGRVAEADEKFSKQFQKGSTRKPGFRCWEFSDTRFPAHTILGNSPYPRGPLCGYASPDSIAEQKPRQPPT